MTSPLIALTGWYRSSGMVLGISVAFVAPFALLQWINRREYQEEFPFLLFAFMFMHSLLVVILATPALRKYRTERRVRLLTPWHWGGLAIAGILAIAYVNVIVDQLPCFLGVPNCD